jgi:hypothetical protein
MIYPVPAERMPPIAPEKMTDAQRQAAADIASGPRGELPRPFVAFLRSPGLMAPVQKLGEYLRYGSALDRRITELRRSCRPDATAGSQAHLGSSRPADGYRAGAGERRRKMAGTRKRSTTADWCCATNA